MGNQMSPFEPSSKQLRAVTSGEYFVASHSQENNDELQKAIQTFNAIIGKLVSNNHNQFMIKNEPESVRPAMQTNRSSGHSRNRSSSVGSSDEDTKIKYKTLFRKPSFERATVAQPPPHLPPPPHCETVFPTIVHSLNHHHPHRPPLPTAHFDPSIYKAQTCQPAPIVESSTAQNPLSINLPEILDEGDEITILRHLIKLLSTKVNKLNEEKRELYHHISTVNQINQELVGIIEKRFQK